MQAEDRVHPGQRALFHHAHAAGFALVVLALFAGLEEQAHAAGQPSLVRQPFEQGGRAQEHGRVGIVTTGVHETGVAAVKVRAVDFGDGQGVHVGAQGHHRPVPAADVADDAGFGDFGLRVDAQVDQGGVDQPGRAGLGEAQFREAVDLPPPAPDLLVDGLGSVQQVGVGDG